MNSFIYRDGQQYGPYTDQQLLEFIASGNVTREDHARREDWTEWKTVNDILSIATVTQPIPFGERTASNDPPGIRLYADFAAIAEEATMKLLRPFADAKDIPTALTIDRWFIKFALFAADFTETCCHEFALVIRRTSTLPHVRGIPTIIMSRDIRSACFSESDMILASFLEALKECDVDINVASARLRSASLQDSNFIGAALNGAALGRLAGGSGRAGSYLSTYGAAKSLFGELDRQITIKGNAIRAALQLKLVKIKCQSVARTKMIEYLRNIHSVTKNLLDYGCAKALGGEVDFDLQEETLRKVESSVDGYIVKIICSIKEHKPTDV